MEKESQSATPVKRKRLKATTGWIQLWRLDLERIRQYAEQDDGKVSVAIVLSTWMAVSDLANEARSDTFDATIGVIRSRAGNVARSTVSLALEVLESLGMLSSLENTRATAEGKIEHGSNTWTIRPTRMTLARVSGDPSSDNQPTPPPSKKPNRSDTGYKNSLNLREGLERGREEGKASFPFNNSSHAPGGRENSDPESEWGPR